MLWGCDAGESHGSAKSAVKALQFALSIYELLEPDFIELQVDLYQ